jgi:hypothetical protein
MKKLLLMISALSAGLVSVAQADVSVSGSYGLGLASGQGSSSTVVSGGAIVFGLSADLGNGVTVSTGGTISRDSDAADTSTASTGFTNLTIATGGSSIVVGADVDIAGDGVGELGSVGSDLNDLGGYGTGSVGAGLTDEDGYGVGLTTAFGTASVTASYILDASTPSNNATSSNADTASGVQITLPMGAMSITAGMGQDDSADGGTHTGVEGSMALGGGTLSVGTFSTSNESGTDDTRGYGAKFATTLGSASVSVGYRYRDNTTDNVNSTVTSASVSQSIGAGASIFIDAVNYSGFANASETGTNIAVGTTFSF